MTIPFEQVPSNVRVPFAYVEFSNRLARPGLNLLPYRALLIGQKTSAGSKNELELIKLSSAEQALAYFGPGSMLHNEAEAMYANAPFADVWAIALDDAAGSTAAAGEILFGGDPTVGGIVALYIAGERVAINIRDEDTPADIAGAMVDAINAKSRLPVSAQINGGTPEQVDLTAKNAGTIGNDIDLRLNYFNDEDLPTGLTVAITEMAGGAGSIDMDEVVDALGDEWFQVIVTPYTDAANLTSLEDELEDRFGPIRQIDGVAFSAARGTHAELTTLGDSRNSPHISILNNNGVPNSPWETAAAVAGQVMSKIPNPDELTRPFQTLELETIKAPAESDRFTITENNLLLYDGIATFQVDASGKVRIQRLITTYQVNQNDTPDISYLDVNTLLTLSFLRYDFRNYFLTKYPRHKLANDGTRFSAGQAIITPKLAKAEAIARFRQWEERALVEGIDQFKADLVVERNADDPNRLDFLLPPDLVNQLRVVGAQIAFLL